MNLSESPNNMIFTLIFDNFYGTGMQVTDMTQNTVVPINNSGGGGVC